MIIPIILFALTLAIVANCELAEIYKTENPLYTPCSDCEKEYLGRQFGTRLKEHQKAFST